MKVYKVLQGIRRFMKVYKVLGFMKVYKVLGVL